MSVLEGTRHRQSKRRRLRERDGDDCHLCRGLMLFNSPGDPDYATIDHIVPRSKGGGNEIENLKLAHAKCNSRRKDGPVERMGWEL